MKDTLIKILSGAETNDRYHNMVTAIIDREPGMHIFKGLRCVTAVGSTEQINRLRERMPPEDDKENWIFPHQETLGDILPKE